MAMDGPYLALNFSRHSTTNHVLTLDDLNSAGCTKPLTVVSILHGRRMGTMTTTIGTDLTIFLSPKIPHSGRIGKDYVLIYMACNDSHEIMDDIMANGEYHDLCRESLGNPETMKLEPAWFRVGLADMPKRFKELGAREN